MLTKEKKFVSLENDWLFKEALSHPDNRYMLIYMLEVLLDIDKEVIKNKLIVNYESPLNKSELKEKNMKGDILVFFDNYIVNIECYKYFTNESLKKSISYITRIFGNQVEVGKNYELKKVIQINIIDNLKMKLNKEMKSKYQIINERDIEDIILEDNLQIRFYQVEKYNKGKITTREEALIRFIGAKTPEEREKIAERSEILMEFNKWLDEYVNDERTASFYGKWNMKLQREAAYEEGIEHGIEQGSNHEKYGIAKEMLNDNVEASKISRYTGLSINDIKNIK